MAVGPHAGPPHGHLPAAEDDLAPHGAAARRPALGHMRIARAQTIVPSSSSIVSNPQSRTDRELEQLGARIHEQVNQREVAGRFNSGGTSDCATLLHGGSFSVRLSHRVWSPLVYHEQRRSRRFNFQQLPGHPRALVNR
jgi:hypothetical protein